MNTRPARRIAALSLALGGMLVLGAQTAKATAALVSTTPTRFAALIHPPRVIQLRFSEAIVKKSSTVRLTDLAGHEVRVKPVESRGDGSLEVAVEGKLGPGVYMVHWTSVSAVDGSKNAGRYQFTLH